MGDYPATCTDNIRPPTPLSGWPKAPQDRHISTTQRYIDVSAEPLSSVVPCRRVALGEYAFTCTSFCTYISYYFKGS